MFKFLIVIGGLLLSLSASAAGNSAFATISYYETRASGAHSVYLNAPIPTVDGCQGNGRGVILDSDPGAKTMSAMIFFALANSMQVQLRVDGCAVANPAESTTTYPKVVKVQLLN